MALLERRNPTPPIAGLTEFLVDEQVRRKFSYSDSFAISSLCIRCACRHITSILNFEVWVARPIFLDFFNTKQVLKVLIKKRHFLLINLSTFPFAVSELVLPHGFGNRLSWWLLLEAMPSADVTDWAGALTLVLFCCLIILSIAVLEIMVRNSYNLRSILLTRMTD